MTKVLIVGNHPSVKGGITTVISQIREHDWKKENVEMKFIPTYIDKNNVFKIFYFLISYIRIFIQFLYWNPDVCHIHMSYKGSFTRKYMIHKLCKLFSIKDIIHLHGSEFEKWYMELDENKKKKVKELLLTSDNFIVLGEKWNKAIKNIESRTKTLILNNSVHIPEETTYWNQSTFNILFLGVLIERKGVIDLLKAVKEISKKIDSKEIHFIIAGTGKQEDALKKYCIEEGINEYVEFKGWIECDTKIDLLKHSQLLVLPSYNEGLPVAILEAISYGLPIIATDVGDIHSAVKNGENGYLIRPGDYIALSEQILSITDNEALFEKFSMNSRKLAENDFSDEVFFSKILQCYIE